jgi:hypothetical protein
VGHYRTPFHIVVTKPKWITDIGLFKRKEIKLYTTFSVFSS